MEPGALVIRRSRGTSFLITLGSLAFVAGGVFIINGGVADSTRSSPEMIAFFGWAALIFFGLAAIAGVWGMVKPAELVLTSDGFQVRDVRIAPLVRWRDIERFTVASVRGARFVSYWLKPETKPMQLMAKIDLGEFPDGALPAHLEKSPEQVCAIMEDWRRRYGAG